MSFNIFTQIPCGFPVWKNELPNSLFSLSRGTFVTLRVQQVIYKDQGPVVSVKIICSSLKANFQFLKGNQGQLEVYKPT